MEIVYATLTNKTGIFAKKLSKKLSEYGFEHHITKLTKNLHMDKPFVLITYTFGHGEVPKSVDKFLHENYCNLVGVVGTGDKSWGIQRYNKASEIISNRYQVPLLHQLEKQGFDSDVEITASKIISLEKGEYNEQHISS